MPEIIKLFNTNKPEKYTKVVIVTSPACKLFRIENNDAGYNHKNTGHRPAKI